MPPGGSNASAGGRPSWCAWPGWSCGVSGTPRPGATLLLANHISWLDIVAIHAVAPQARFVSKADVLAWPLLGWLIKGAGTLFIERERKRDALRVLHQVAEALKAGDTVAVFPEGTTGDGATLLPFHANLLQAAIATGTPVQRVALRYSDPAPSLQPGGAVPRRDHACCRASGACSRPRACACTWTCCCRRARATPTGARWPSSARPDPCTVARHDADGRGRGGADGLQPARCRAADPDPESPA